MRIQDNEFEHSENNSSVVGSDFVGFRKKVLITSFVVMLILAVLAGGYIFVNSWLMEKDRQKAAASDRLWAERNALKLKSSDIRTGYIDKHWRSEVLNAFDKYMHNEFSYNTIVSNDFWDNLPFYIAPKEAMSKKLCDKGSYSIYSVTRDEQNKNQYVIQTGVTVPDFGGFLKKCAANWTKYGLDDGTAVNYAYRDASGFILDGGEIDTAVVQVNYNCVYVGNKWIISYDEYGYQVRCLMVNENHFI